MRKFFPLIVCAVLISCTKAEQPEDQPYVAKDIVCNLENKYIAEYLDQAEKQYTDTNWVSVSYITKTNQNFWTSTSTLRKDFPAPAEISWTMSTLDTSVVNLYTDNKKKELVDVFVTADKSVTIYNLIPGRSYFYTISNTKGKTLIQGNLITTGRRRMIKLSTTYAEGRANNCRDLGGLKTVDGKTLKYGLIYRGTKMDDTTDDEKMAITRELGVKMDVDLRKDGVNPFADKNWGVRYSLSTYGSWSGQNKLYDLNYGPNIKHTFTDIIEATTTSTPIYIHCSAGADRTGYICMLLEAALGVSQKDCSIDYELTSFSIVGGRDRTCDIKDYYFESGMTYIQDYPKGSSFTQKAENILLDAGITAEQIADFRKAMTE